MPIPISYLLGLLCVFGASELVDALPVDPDATRFVPFLWLLLVPYVAGRIGALQPTDPPPGRLARIRALPRRLPALLLVPGVFFVLIAYGDWVGVAGAIARACWVDTAAVTFVVAILPLLWMEWSGNLGLRQHLARRGFGIVEGQHMRWIAFATIPVLLFQIGVDLVALHRSIEVFVLGTAVGLVLGVLVLILILMVVLPAAFRAIMLVSDDVPTALRQVAQALAFPADDVLQLHTGFRMVNAALVGPLPRFRFLFLSDGLLRVLDPISLSGVVAHEVGHARGGHPMLLFVLFLVIPLLLLHPLDATGFGELSEVAQVAVLLSVLGVGVLVLHLVAHRFELEADQLSSDALGGAMPCILALQKVGDLFGDSVTRSSLRHPSEERRINHLLKCDGDPWYRERFVRAGRRLRFGIVAGLLAALVANIWAQSSLWSLDRLVYSFYTGRFEATDAAIRSISAAEREALTERETEFLDELAEEVMAARTLYPKGGDWNAIRADLAARAWERGRKVLTAGEGVASMAQIARARAWFSLGMAKRNPSAEERSLHLLANAAASDSQSRFVRVRGHLLREFTLDAKLRRALGGE